MKEVFAIGLMSGTSLDGLDICYAKFTKKESWLFEILEAKTSPYPTEWENRLRNSMLINAEELMKLNSDYGFYLGQETRKFIQQHSIKKIDVIASHGHTIFHQPHDKFTTQIGDGRAIKLITNIPVVYDFRSQDVLMGGNGAPLVPIGDKHLFSDYDACVNLGGFSNISFNIEGKRIAFDICPVNFVLNKIAEFFKQKYDKNGHLAKQGKIIPELLNTLNNIDFYSKKHPRSLGAEWVNQVIFPLLNQDNKMDILATFTEHIAEQISDVIEVNQLKKVLFTGGGAYNQFLMERIKTKTSAEIVIPESEIVDFKEALIFAFMGALRIRNENNILSSATGSSADHCSGLLV